MQYTSTRRAVKPVGTPPTVVRFNRMLRVRRTAGGAPYGRASGATATDAIDPAGLDRYLAQAAMSRARPLLPAHLCGEGRRRLLWRRSLTLLCGVNSVVPPRCPDHPEGLSTFDYLAAASGRGHFLRAMLYPHPCGRDASVSSTLTPGLTQLSTDPVIWRSARRLRRPQFAPCGGDRREYLGPQL